MHRLFVAIRPPERIRDLLIDAMDVSLDFRWVDEQQLHLTLRFIGEVERPTADDLAHALVQIRARQFDARISGLGRFEQRNAGALWAAVEPKTVLSALASKIERVAVSVGLAPERRAFHPHITLARWKGRRTREVESFLERKAALSSEPFAVREVILFESRLSRHGPHYAEAARYELE